VFLFAGTWSGAVLLEIFNMPLLSQVVSKGSLRLIAVTLIYSLAICCTFVGLFYNAALVLDEPFYEIDPTVCHVEENFDFEFLFLR
jgi:hypothetical protein